VTRWFALPAFALAMAGAFLFWSWLGRPQAVPDAPGGQVTCLSYSPYRPGQSPFDPGFTVPRAQIEEDMRLLATETPCVRSYGVAQGLDAVVPAAEAVGLQVILGAWLSRDPAHNTSEIGRAIELANAHPDTVRAIVIGNEVILRGELAPERLAALLRDAQTRTEIPITYADVWEYWTRHAAVLADAVDFVTIHILPYWEDEPVAIGQAIAYVEAIYARSGQLIPGKKLMIGETGWPSAGRMRDGALPSRVNAATFLRGFTEMATRQGLDYNLIEAFDQPWKRALEGTVGGNWGLFTATRQPKFPLTGPVSNLPHWPVSFVAASLFAAMPMLWAVLRRRALGTGGWGLLAAGAQAAGSVLMLQADAAITTSRTPFAFAAAAAGLSITTATAWLLLDAFAARDPGMARPAPVRAVLAWLRKPLPAQATRPVVLGLLRLLAVGGGLATSLGLVFDPRYRDFPVAAFLVPAAGFALAFLFAGRRSRTTDGAAEELWLGTLLALAGVVIALREGFANDQALSWTALCLLLALPLARISRGRIAESS
jgi:glucan 1,3-beta-glucosidase